MPLARSTNYSNSLAIMFSFFCVHSGKKGKKNARAPLFFSYQYVVQF